MLRGRPWFKVTPFLTSKCFALCLRRKLLPSPLVRSSSSRLNRNAFLFPSLSYDGPSSVKQLTCHSSPNHPPSIFSLWFLYLIVSFASFSSFEQRAVFHSVLLVKKPKQLAPNWIFGTQFRTLVSCSSAYVLNQMSHLSLLIMLT